MSDQLCLRRIGVIGDIHAEDARLETALCFLRGQAVDMILAVGDIADGPGDLNRCCDLLREYGVAAVRGNHERWLRAGKMRFLPEANQDEQISEASWRYLTNLPVYLEFDTTAGRLLLCHGIGDNDMAAVRPWNSGDNLESVLMLDRLRRSGEYRFVVNGHTHQRMVRTFAPLTMINAGTLLRRHDPCFLLADFAAAGVQYYNLTEPDTPSPAEFIPL
ncbi:MAG: metallophosphoesterase family protein [Blastocatellia bacterium]